MPGANYSLLPANWQLVHIIFHSNSWALVWSVSFYYVPGRPSERGRKMWDSLIWCPFLLCGERGTRCEMKGKALMLSAELWIWQAGWHWRQFDFVSATRSLVRSRIRIRIRIHFTRGSSTKATGLSPMKPERERHREEERLTKKSKRAFTLRSNKSQFEPNQ